MIRGLKIPGGNTDGRLILLPSSLTHTHNCLTALCPGQPRWAGTTRNIHPHTHTSWSSNILYQLPPSTMIYSILLVQFMCLAVLSQPLSRSSLVYLYISLPNHYLLFTTHAHTIATCLGLVVPRLCHLFLISLSAHYLETVQPVTNRISTPLLYSRQEPSTGIEESFSSVQ